MTGIRFGVVARLAAQIAVGALAITFVSAPFTALADDPVVGSTAGPLADPTDPSVDASVIVAVPKTGVAPRAIAAEVEVASEQADAEEVTELVANPPAAAPEVAVVVHTDPAASDEVIAEMVDSGLYQSVDYEVYYTVSDYTSTPNDTYLSDAGQWGVRAYPGARFDEAWPLLNSVSGAWNTAPVAVIDTGFQMSNIDKGSNIVAGWNTAASSTDVNPTCSQHGTHVAGTIGAATNNGRGVAGAAWDNKVIIYKAIRESDCRFPIESIIDAMSRATAAGARVISMSLGGPGATSNFQTAINTAWSAGVVVVAAAGNSGASGFEYPAAYDHVISVAAIEPSGERASFSQVNSAVDIAAPGTSIYSLWGNSYATMQGTSMATPHVSAASRMGRSCSTHAGYVDGDAACVCGRRVGDPGQPVADARRGRNHP